MRIAFIGLPENPISLASLEACLSSGHKVDVFVSFRRGEEPVAPQIDGIVGPQRDPWRPWYGDIPELKQIVSQNGVDLLVAAGCYHILPPEILKIPIHGCLNIHPSMLPKFRGGDPIFWQYRLCDLEAGMTIHWMDEGLDTGDILNQVGFAIELGEPMQSSELKYAGAANSLLLKTLDEIECGSTEPIKQSHLPCPDFARMPRDEDFAVEWDEWPLERVWHFLRMGPFISAGNLPPAPGFQGWSVGEMIKGDSFGPPGSVGKDSQGNFVNHSQGIIRL